MAELAILGCLAGVIATSGASFRSAAEFATPGSFKEAEEARP